MCAHTSQYTPIQTHTFTEPPNQHTYPDPHTHQEQRYIDTQSKRHTEIYDMLRHEATVMHSHAHTAAQTSTQHTWREAVQGSGHRRQRPESMPTASKSPSVAPFLPFLSFSPRSHLHLSWLPGEILGSCVKIETEWGLGPPLTATQGIPHSRLLFVRRAGGQGAGWGWQ